MAEYHSKQQKRAGTGRAASQTAKKSVASSDGAATATFPAADIDFFNDAMTPGTAWKVTIMMAIAVLSMATLRHGMRQALTGPAMAQAKVSTDKYVAAVQDHRKMLAAAPQAEKVALTGGEALADKNGCLACHNAAEKLVGPAYKDVAAKGYAPKDIAALVKTPKPSNWPDYPEMPAMPQVPDEELKQIAEWIVSLKK